MSLLEQTFVQFDSVVKKQGAIMSHHLSSQDIQRYRQRQEACSKQAMPPQ
jgi:hypothetical protein